MKHFKLQLIVLYFLLVITILSTVSASSVELTLATPTGKLYGTLESPNTEVATKAKENIVVLIIAGSGPTDRDGNTAALPGKNNSLKLLAEGLAELGYASLRTDKRGVAKSQTAATDEADLRFDTYVTDTVDWLNYLRKEQGFEKLIIIGHSEGSLIAMLAAQQVDVAAFISLAGPGFPAQDILRTQLSSQLNQTMFTGVEEVLNSLEDGNLVTDLPDSIASVPPIAALFRDSVQPYLISWFAYDPSEVLADLNLPILIIQGSHDIQVSVEDAEALKAANETSDLVIIEGMNHIFKQAPKQRMLNMATYTNPDLALAEGFIESIDSFLMMLTSDE